MRHHLAFVLLGVLPSLGASYRTQNFVVDAVNPQVAKQIGDAAEYWRKDKANQWLGYDMPAWPEPCPIKVKVTMNGAGGATSFAFDGGRVLGQHMTIEGSLDRLLASVLPHEVTHTVFAFRFRTPVPRWADEGGAVFSEDDIEKDRHDKLCRQILNAGRKIPLRTLFNLHDYPAEVMTLYAEGYSVVNFLVALGNSNKPGFLNFVEYGMRYGWDRALQYYYKFQNIDELENAWLTQLQKTRRTPVQFARNTLPTEAELAQRTVVRQTVQPVLSNPAPVFRGRSANPGQEGERFEDSNRQTAAARPGYLPDYIPSTNTPTVARPTTPQYSYEGQPNWQPSPAGSQGPAVRLGTPQYIPQPQQELKGPSNRMPWYPN